MSGRPYFETAFIFLRMLKRENTFYNILFLALILSIYIYIPIFSEKFVFSRLNCLINGRLSHSWNVDCDRSRLDFLDFVILFDLKINRFQIFCGSMVILVSLTYLTSRY